MNLSARSRSIFIFLLLALLVIMVASYLRLSKQIVQQDDFNHMPKERYLLLSAIESSLGMKSTAQKSVVCESLVKVSNSMSKLLKAGMHDDKIVIDPGALRDQIVKAWGQDAPPSCEQAAKKIRVLVNAGHLKTLVATRGQVRYLQTVTSAALVTRNPWWGIPGNITAQDGQKVNFNAGSTKTPSFSDLFGMPYGYIGQDLPTLLQSTLAPLSFSPSGTVDSQFGRDWPRGKNAQLTLQPALQRDITHDANCDVGSDDQDCPPQPRLKAGLIGYVVVALDTNSVVAIGGAVSDCVNAQLKKAPVNATDENGKQFVPVFADEATPCPQFPNVLSPQLLPKKDKRGDIDLLPMPSVSIPFLLSSTGSSYKPFVVAAGIRAGNVSSSNEAYWRCTLAHSRDCGTDPHAEHNQRAMQGLAISSASHWRDVLTDAGLLSNLANTPNSKDPKQIYENVAVQTTNAITGLPNPVDPKTGKQILSSQVLTELSFPQIGEGILPKERYFNASGKDRMDKRFLRSAALAASSIGSADFKSSVFGLAQAWTILAQNSLGKQTMPALHLATIQGQPTPMMTHKVLDPAGAQFLLTLLNQAHVSGTTSSACLKAFGAKKCSNLKIFSKTGSADFSTCRVKGQKPCLQFEIKVDSNRPHYDALPTKWFGTFFTTTNGKHYVVATMALRTRAADGKLDTSNAAADLGMRILRRLEDTPMIVEADRHLSKLTTR